MIIYKITLAFFFIISINSTSHENVPDQFEKKLQMTLCRAKKDNPKI